jgi:hypothetical protein
MQNKNFGSGQQFRVDNTLTTKMTNVSCIFDQLTLNNSMPGVGSLWR